MEPELKKRVGKVEKTVKTGNKKTS